MTQDQHSVRTNQRSFRLLSRSTPRIERWKAGFGRFVFLAITGAIISVSSERMFWYWSSNPLDHWVIALYYGAVAAAVLWVIQRFRVNSLSSLLLVAPIFAYMVEGIITPILYTGGPFVPFFPAWFSFWHGFLGLVGLWYLLHLWLINGQTRRIAWASIAMGLFWGMWSITMLLPGNFDDPELIEDHGGPLEILAPMAFARYAVSFSLILAGMHWLWGRLVKPVDFEPSVWSKRLYVVAVVTILVVWSVAIPWAAPMFAAYVAIQIWVLRRHAQGATGPGLFEQLSGRVRGRHLLALVPLPATAAATYTLLWELDLSLGLIEAFMFTVIFAQSVIGLVVLVRHIRRTLKQNPKHQAEPEMGARS
ncbi:MAG: hypothetical protein GXP35_11845 [Actinobacteria bacterium]|nr:hypothetical protein [Actinomycetota bacterium]